MEGVSRGRGVGRRPRLAEAWRFVRGAVEKFSTPFAIIDSSVGVDSNFSFQFDGFIQFFVVVG